MGYFHPLLVHLPIGFLLLAILMDLLAYRSAFVQYRAAVPSTLFCGGTFVLWHGLFAGQFGRL